jgi:hypothetical protein
MLPGQNLSGQLSDWSIDDLLQIMQVTKKTGSLDIEGERRGRVHFVDGAVTGAELSGERGSYRGVSRAAIADILYVLSTLEVGSFGVGAADGPDGEGFAVDDIMDEVTSLRSLEGEVIDAGLFEAPGVKLVGEVSQPITMEPEDWRVIVSLVQPFTFDFLESRVGRGAAVRIFHTLHRLGVAEGISGDEESEWLDKLAGGLSPASSEPTWFEQLAVEDGDAEQTAVERSDPVEQAPSSVAGSAADEPAVAGPVVEEPVAARPVVEEPVAARPVVEEPVAAAEPTDHPPAPTEEPATESEAVVEPNPASADVRGVSADASTTLTDGVYDEIRRLRSKVSEG